MWLKNYTQKTKKKSFKVQFLPQSRLFHFPLWFPTHRLHFPAIKFIEKNRIFMRNITTFV